MKRFFKFYKTLKKRRYDFIHMHVAFNRSFLGTLVFMLIAKITRTKVLLHIHGTDWKTRYVQVNPGLKLVYRIGLRIPDQILVLFDLWKSKIQALAPRTPVKTLGNFLEDFKPTPAHQCEKIRYEFGIPDDHFLVLTVGFIGWRKGQLDILDAVPEIVNRVKRVRFVMVGGEEFPGESAPVRQRIEQEGLGRWVSVIDEIDRERVIACMSESDIFLLPSRREGMPMSILEAMRAGLPIVSTTVGGIPEMIEHEKAGILIPPGSPSQIARAVVELLENEKLRKELGKAARKTFEDKFERDVATKKLAAIYKTIVSRFS
ncbi:MAG: glycosyltransferase family 4 protein [Desulfomonilaceae bacterium]